MRYQIKKPALQKLWFVVDAHTAQVIKKLSTKRKAEHTCAYWNDRAQEETRERFSVHGLRLVAG